MEKDGETIESGRIPFAPLAVGDVREVSAAAIPIPNLTAPAAVTLRVRIAGSDVMNHWNLYVFPKRKKPSAESIAVAPEFLDFFREHYENVLPYGDPKMTADTVLVAPFESESYQQGIAEGRRILAIRPTQGAPNIRLGWWAFGQQLGTAFFDHPAFGDFPHRGSLDPLWFRLVKDDPLDLASAVGEYEPLALGETVDGYTLYAGFRKEGKAVILAAFGLDLLQEIPEALSLLDNFLSAAGRMP